MRLTMKLRELKEVLHLAPKIVLYNENNDDKIIGSVEDIPSYLDYHNVTDVYVSYDHENHLAIFIE